MILTVDHVTCYRYNRPARALVQSHRLMPSNCAGQRVLNWTVTVTDGIAGGTFRDGAGDWIQGWTVPGPVSEVTVAVRGAVETSDQAGVLRGHRELTPPDCYLRSTPVTRADAALTALAAEAGGAGEALDRAHRLADLVADAIAYEPGVTEAHTTAAEALKLGRGVCQDHAHALIAVARAAGLPARYVSGYLFTEAGRDHEAAHAWAEVWVHGLGWVGFDAANRCCPDDRYIRLGSGLDAADAAPIRGIARGHGIERLEVQVAVQAVQQ
ncbi:transglutaminase family protein [Cereibacter azotoformans]|uniref:Transglutaminase-like putative cysteine protease n=1 Tax=Cereibacter azotoformans TaxID=43057 RepID=A0A2T5KD76_9RHOB|nr:transglutaminase family protein [Cereibacter azotoformans]AXQ93592.1 transglutaminase family protein [Cereibacter sphaeroides]MBO4168640.1 transglutaminase family protein [Cereibacter azotoformans]PTR20370.1 transglutaminase-like putative cysteine protease [Cereibacter azotoformans]UIJ31930.1 transglutaminase family protein [Cereibacter azotoformans]